MYNTKFYPIETLTFTSLVLNSKGKNYKELKSTWTQDYEDNHWAEDSIFLERNSRNFVPRIERINANAEAICDVLRAHPRGKHRLPCDCLKAQSNCFDSEACVLPQVQ